MHSIAAWPRLAHGVSLKELWFYSRVLCYVRKRMRSSWQSEVKIRTLPCGIGLLRVLRQVIQATGIFPPSFSYQLYKVTIHIV